MASECIGASVIMLASWDSARSWESLLRDALRFACAAEGTHSGVVCGDELIVMEWWSVIGRLEGCVAVVLYLCLCLGVRFGIL